jgi:glycosyltransferase involved in cell wall biosynthesis/GT2 family glycosyltransferase
LHVLRVSHSAVVDGWRERERALRRGGVEVTLLSARRWNEGGAEVQLVPRAGEVVEGVRTWGRHPALFVYDPRPIWKALGAAWDVIDIHEEPFALATAEILLLRRLRRQSAPYVLYSAQNLAKRYPAPFRWTERWSLLHAGGISVCNSGAAEIVQRKGFPGRPALIGLGVDRTRFHPGDDQSPDRSGWHTVVGYVGRLERHKGVDVLLRAIADDPSTAVRIGGAGPEATALSELAGRLGISDRVEFFGPLTQGELPAFYRSVDVLAVPSRTTDRWVEQFGRVVVEAMACGTPVVASASGALPEVVGDAGLLVPEDDPPALGAAIREAAGPVVRQRLCEAGPRRAKRYDWSVVAKEYAELYRRVRHSSPEVPSPRPLEVVVVAYGAADLLRNALEPLTGLHVTVVDNSSSLEVKQVAADVGATYVDPGSNAGFAAGVNLALRHHHDRAADVLLLNPDAVIAPEHVALLQDALVRDPGLASVGPVQVGPDGHPSRVAWPFPAPGRAWAEAAGLGRRLTRTDFVIGSVLLLRAEAVEHVGELDDAFFLYAEETDWARRACRLGWRHAVVPPATATHVGAGTSTNPVRREVLFHASQERYLRKHHGSLGWQSARAAQLMGSAIRAAIPGDPGRRPGGGSACTCAAR